MDSFLNRTVRLAFGFAMLTLLLMGAVSDRWMDISDESGRWARHTNEVLTNIQNLLLAIENVESSSREFVLTGRESDLDLYHTNVLNVERDQEAIGKLTADNPIQQSRMPALKSLADENIRDTEAIISLRRTEGLAAAVASIQSRRYRQTADQMQALVGKMQDEELRLRTLRRAETDRDQGRTRVVLIVGTLLGMLISGVAGWYALRDSARRSEAERHLVQKVKELNRSNEELVRLSHAAQKMTQHITHSAEHDALTGLPNRLLLNDRVGQAVAFAERHQNQVAVLSLDLDGFKHINNSLGHPIGDRLLQSVARRLVDCVRATDTVSREGGDEFAVLLSEIKQPEDAATKSGRLLQAVARACSIDQHDLHITASIGISIYPDDGLDAETLIRNADTALNQAKEDGRQGYQFFRPAMNRLAVERQSIEEHLRRALERQELALHYQPIISLRTGTIAAVEALIRWTHPIRGSVSPAQFIPVAEDCGLILPIGAWVLREACMQARAWADAGLPKMTMAVNVSAMQFEQESFLDDLFTVLGETGLDPGSLELELTERALMKRADLAASILSTLRGKGIRVAVDDFGTGYSSLSYLRKFPLDALKIDQSFVSQITTIPDETVIITAIISMSRSLNLQVIAEGVETEDQLDFLKAHQCDEAQGYYFSRPVPPQEFVRLLEARSWLPDSGCDSDPFSLD
jgi:diguanylate cyclase (GGDEF)-like protein